MFQSTNDVEEFFRVLEGLGFGKIRHIEGTWMYSYDPHPTTHTDGDRRVSVRLYVSDTEDKILFEKIVDGQKRKYQHTGGEFTDSNPENIDLAEGDDVEYQYFVREQGSTSFQFRIQVEGEPLHDNFFHVEEQPDL